jgi:hypothetical protein
MLAIAPKEKIQNSKIKNSDGSHVRFARTYESSRLKKY